MASFRNYKYTLAANETITPSILGNFVRCYEGTAAFKVRPNNQNPVELQRGVGVDFEQQFNSLEITNGSTAQTIEIYVGDGVILDNRLITAGGVQINGNQNADYGNVSVTTTATLIKAANTTRSNVLLVNNGGGDLFIGNDNSVTTSNGILVKAGQSMTVTFQDDVYGICAAGSLDIRYLEESN